MGCISPNPNEAEKDLLNAEYALDSIDVSDSELETQQTVLDMLDDLLEELK